MPNHRSEVALAVIAWILAAAAFVADLRWDNGISSAIHLIVLPAAVIVTVQLARNSVNHALVVGALAGGAWFAVAIVASATGPDPVNTMALPSMAGVLALFFSVAVIGSDIRKDRDRPRSATGR